MALGAMTLVSEAGLMPSAPTFIARISFLGDAAYPTGGTAAFEALVQAKLGRQVTVVGVIPQDCNGFTPTYDRANNKLKVFRTGAANAAQEQVPNATDLSGSTFNVLVVCQ